jgi:hypothetical protein
MDKNFGSAAAQFSDVPETSKRRLSSIGAFPAMQQGPAARLATEVFVPLVGGPGTLARAVAAVSAAGGNIAGYAEVSHTLHLLSEDSRAARAALTEAGFLPTEAEVVVLAVVDLPGTAEKAFRRIAAANINVMFSYMATDNRLVIGVGDALEAARILND